MVACVEPETNGAMMVPCGEPKINGVTMVKYQEQQWMGSWSNWSIDGWGQEAGAKVDTWRPEQFWTVRYQWLYTWRSTSGYLEAGEVLDSEVPVAVYLEEPRWIGSWRGSWISDEGARQLVQRTNTCDLKLLKFWKLCRKNL